MYVLQSGFGGYESRGKIQKLQDDFTAYCHEYQSLYGNEELNNELLQLKFMGVW